MDIYVNYVDDALKIIFKAAIPFKAKLDQNQDRMRYPTLSCQKLTIYWRVLFRTLSNKPFLYQEIWRLTFKAKYISDIALPPRSFGVISSVRRCNT